MNDALQQLVRNWLIKAGNDLKIGQDEMKTDAALPPSHFLLHLQNIDRVDFQARKHDFIYR